MYYSFKYENKIYHATSVSITNYFYSMMLETASGSTGDVKTWVSEYNFPAMMSRCKFPKEYDAIHELQTNKYVLSWF